MKDFKQINACDVVTHLAAGKIVYACILQSQHFTTRLVNLSTRKMADIVRVTKEENVVFFEKVEE